MSIKAELVKINPDLKDLELVIADSTDEIQVWNMVGRTKTIVSTVGPYARFGNVLVHCCVEQNTDYCDITGEIHWVRFNINRYEEAAKKSGARLIFSAGCDSVPWDIATYLVNDKIDEGDSLVVIEHQNDMKSTFSGGTLSTILNMVDGRYTCRMLPKPKYDPLRKVSDGNDGVMQSEGKFSIKNTNFMKPTKDKKWLGISMLAGGNSRIVSRSFAMNKYSSKLTYIESNVYDSFINTFLQILGLGVLVTVLLFKPFRHLMLKLKWLPNPGEGPSEKQMDTHYTIIHTTGTTEKGKQIKLQTVFNEDIGYRDTARMLAESGLCFVFNDDKISQEGGLHTPASCLGMALKERLEASGTEFNFC